MERDLWQRIEHLYHGASGRNPYDRSEYLEQVCGGDESLRRELEQLLALDEQARDWIEVPALEFAAQDLSARLPQFGIGQTFDRYRILGLAGWGGMGIVYSAHDCRLERTVALKFLLDELTCEFEAQDRFRREATTLSSLNHPNICTIYDVGETQGRTYIATEYVTGASLDRYIEGKGLPLNDALKYAIEIADGLAKAHSAGIVHRDLKPSNIMITDDGHVKLLDFGLAKRIERASSGEVSKTHSTVSGIIAGTVAYMSPEQAKGQSLDARSDVFSFGAVLYQMITGESAFRGESTLSTMSAILHHDAVSAGALSRTAPVELQGVLRRCLQKNPENRFANGAEMLEPLERVRDVLVSRQLAGGKAIPRLIIAACVFVLIASAAVVGLSRRTSGNSVRDLVLTRLTSDAGLTAHPVISRDGKMLAYASDRGGMDNLDIWVQQVAGGPPVRLTNNPADDIQPDFSPDGSKLVFSSRRESDGIYVISTLGGEEQLHVPAKRALFPRFSPDGNSIVYSIGSVVGPAKIYTVSSAGGAPKELQVQIPWAKNPIWSPDGMHLIFLGSTNPLGLSSYDWWVAPAAGGQAVKTGALERLEQHGLSLADEIRGFDSIFSIPAIPGAWLRSDQIIFSARMGDSTNLWRVTLDRKNWKIRIGPERVTTGSSQEFSPSVADDGRMVFATIDQRQNLWTLPLDTNRARATGKAEVLTQAGVSNTRPSLSRDGRTLVFLSDRSGNTDVWMMDMEKGTESALTATPSNENYAQITPDGLKLAYLSLEKPNPSIYVLPVGTGARQKLCDDCVGPYAWFPDGARILFYRRGEPLSGWRVMDVVTGARADVIRHPKRTVNMPRLSFDGEWLAFHLPMPDEQRSAIFIVPLRNTPVAERDWIRITDGVGIEATPWWSPDGGTLYFLSRRDGFQCIWAQRLNKSKRPTGDPFDIAHFHAARRRVREVGFGPGVAADKLIFTMNETAGNLWLTDIKRWDLTH